MNRVFTIYSKGKDLKLSINRSEIRSWKQASRLITSNLQFLTTILFLTPLGKITGDLFHFLITQLIEENKNTRT